MDDTAQNPTRYDPSGKQFQDPADDQRHQLQDQSQIPVHHSQHGGSHMSGAGGNKEAAPVPIRPVEEPTEYITASDHEPQLHPEVAAAGVEAHHERAHLSHHDKQAGLTHSGDMAPAATQPQGTVQLPMTGDQAVSIIKTHKNTSDSILWKATMVLKEWRKRYQQMKHG